MIDKILIIAFNEKWVGISRLPSGLDRAGFEVYALCPKNSYLAQTKYLKKTLFYPYWIYRTQTKLMYLWLIMAILKFKPDLIIPADENAIQALHRLANFLVNFPILKKVSKRIRKSMTAKEFDSTILNKSNFQSKCHDWGIRSPRNIIVDNVENALVAAAQINFPVVLKHDVGAGGVGVFICQNADDLKTNFYQVREFSFFKKIKALIKKNILIAHSGQYSQISVQVFIKGKLGVAAFCALDGEVFAINSMLTLKSNPENTGPTSVAEGINCLEIKEYVEIMVKHIRYTGFGALDFIYEEDSGKIFIIEFNARPTPTCHLGSKVVANDLCEMMFKGMNSLPKSEVVFKTFMIAMYPAEKRRDPNSPYLTQAFHDIPENDPTLLKILDS